MESLFENYIAPLTYLTFEEAVEKSGVRNQKLSMMQAMKRIEATAKKHPK